MRLEHNLLANWRKRRVFAVCPVTAVPSRTMIATRSSEKEIISQCRARLFKLTNHCIAHFETCYESQFL